MRSFQKVFGASAEVVEIFFCKIFFVNRAVRRNFSVISKQEGAIVRFFKYLQFESTDRLRWNRMLESVEINVKST